MDLSCLWVVALRLLLVPELLVQVYLNCCVNASQTKKWESWTQQAGNFLLLSLHPSCASLHFSSVCLCSSLKHCAQSTQTSCWWMPCSPLCPGGFGKSRGWHCHGSSSWSCEPSLPCAALPSDMVESAGASSYGVFQSLYLPFLFPCPGLGGEQAGVRLVPKQRGGWQDLP